jgi:hypothetical protein
VPRSHSGTMRGRNHRVLSLLAGGTTGGLRPCKPNRTTVLSYERNGRSCLGLTKLPHHPNCCLLAESDAC